MKRPVLIALLALLLDQLAKFAARNGLPADAVPPGPSWFGFRLALHVNEGVSFGAFSGWGLVLGFGGVAILLLLSRSPFARSHLGKTAIALLWGGGLGNLTDRVLFGGVTDFLFVPLPFLPGGGLFVNLGDGWLCLGALLLLLVAFRSDSEER